MARRLRCRRRYILLPADMIPFLYIAAIIAAIGTGQARAEEYFGKCDMHPDQIVRDVLDIVTLDDFAGFSEEEFIPPWYQLWQENWPFEPQAYGRYFFIDNSIHLNLPKMQEFGALEQCSIIAHEITHSLQFQAGLKMSVANLETHAYQVQDLFIRQYLDEYSQRQANDGNGLAQVRQFRKIASVLSHDGHHDLENTLPESCNGDLFQAICIWH